MTAHIASFQPRNFLLFFDTASAQRKRQFTPFSDGQYRVVQSFERNHIDERESKIAVDILIGGIELYHREANRILTVLIHPRVQRRQNLLSWFRFRVQCSSPSLSSKERVSRLQG